MPLKREAVGPSQCQMNLGANMGTLGQDIRYALRNLRKAPGFALVAVVTLALGIGASTAIFSVIDNILMEPFPYPDAQRYYSAFIHDTDRSEPGGRPAFIGPEFVDYLEQNHVLDRAIGNDQTDVLYRSGEGTQRFDGNFVTPGTFEFLGMPALMGRVMQPADYEPGAPPVFVLRYKTWMKSFGADTGIVNKTFVLNGVSRTLIGIMPPRFGWGDAGLGIAAKLARATTREKDVAIRSALGANRWRLIRQLLVESLILATGGAAVGTLMAWGGLKSLVALMPQNIIPAEAVIRLNLPVLMFTLVVAMLTALVFGLVPALKAARKDLNEPLRDSGKGISGGFRHGRLRDAVVGLEVGLSLTLLVGAGLLLRSFVALRDLKRGLQPDHVSVSRLPLPVDRSKTTGPVIGVSRTLR